MQQVERVAGRPSASASTVARSTPPGNGASARSRRLLVARRAARYDDAMRGPERALPRVLGPRRPVARSRARSSRSRTARSGITATCRAASSMPSGSPSRRRSTSTRSAASLGGRCSKPGGRRRACSTKARTPGCRRSAPRSATSRGHGQRLQPDDVLPRHLQGDPRGREHPDATGARRRSAADERAAGLDEVLAVVEHEEQLAVGQGCRDVVRPDLAGQSAVRGARPRPARRGPAGRPRRGRRPRPRSAPTLHVRGDVEREPGLAHAAGAGEGDDAVRVRAGAAPPRGRAGARPSGCPAGRPGAGRRRRDAARVPAATCCSRSARAGVGSSPVSSTSRRRKACAASIASAARPAAASARTSRQRRPLAERRGGGRLDARPRRRPGRRRRAVPRAGRRPAGAAARRGRPTPPPASGIARNSVRAGPRHSASAALRVEPARGAGPRRRPARTARAAAGSRRLTAPAGRRRSPRWRAQPGHVVVQRLGGVGRRVVGPEARRRAGRCRPRGRPRAPAAPAASGAARPGRRPSRPSHPQRQRAEHVDAQRQLRPVHAGTVPE